MYRVVRLTALAPPTQVMRVGARALGLFYVTGVLLAGAVGVFAVVGKEAVASAPVAALGPFVSTTDGARLTLT